MANGRTPRSEIEAIFAIKGRDPLAESAQQIGDVLGQVFAIKRARKEVENERQARLQQLTSQAELKLELEKMRARNQFIREEERARRQDDQFKLKEERLREQFNKAQSLREQQLAIQQQQRQQTKQKQPTTSQSQAATFANRIALAEQAFQNLKQQGFDPTTPATRLQRLLPEAIKTQALKAQEQAERNFVNAVLRRESGAAIAASEFDSAERQYFPRVGDSEEVLAQKRRNRQIVFQGLRAEATGQLPPVLRFPGSVKEAQQQIEQQLGLSQGVQSFNTTAQAEAADLPPGTVVEVQGEFFEVE